MFLTLSFISFRVEGFGILEMMLQRSIQKSIKNDAQIYEIHPKSIPKSTKMVPRSAPKATLGASRLEVAKKGAAASYKFEIIGATWAILGAILVPAGRQGRPKIEHFGIKNRKNAFVKSFQKPMPKK